MSLKLTATLVVMALSVGMNANAQLADSAQDLGTEANFIDEIDPADPNIEAILNAYDEYYENQTGLSSRLEESFLTYVNTGCYRMSCKVWAQVSKSRQRMYLYVDGVLQAEWKVSTGTPGHGTPNFDKHPDGRIYDRYTSTKYPGGDYDKLGNMPYAVFIKGGYAIHGTGRGNWSKLGRRASHGCIRLHPDNGYTFNRLVRANGIKNVWITVQD